MFSNSNNRLSLLKARMDVVGTNKKNFNKSKFVFQIGIAASSFASNVFLKLEIISSTIAN